MTRIDNYQMDSADFRAAVTGHVNAMLSGGDPAQVRVVGPGERADQYGDLLNVHAVLPTGLLYVEDVYTCSDSGFESQEIVRIRPFRDIRSIALDELPS